MVSLQENGVDRELLSEASTLGWGIGLAVPGLLLRLGVSEEQAEMDSLVDQHLEGLSEAEEMQDEHIRGE